MKKQVKNGSHTDQPIILSKNKLTLGQKASDKLTGFMGSWTFIIIFIFYILLWMGINLIGWHQGWDPYPFILLNLTLSCLAALQAPIILMSQNRIGQKDRVMAKYDYQIDRKTEREIRDMQADLEEIKKMIRKIPTKK